MVALSGLDGAGKSSQAAALAARLGKEGFDVEIAWTRIGFNERFWDAAKALKSALNTVVAVGRRDGAGRARYQEGLGAAKSSPSPLPAGTGTDAVKSLRQRSRVLTELWASMIALDNIVAQRRLVLPHLRAGRVVICDRYTLDSIVSLRYLIDDRRPRPLQRALLRAGVPRPRRAYLLDVDAQTALERKGQETLTWLAAHAELYRQECSAVGVTRLDGKRSAADLSAQIAKEVLSVLSAGPKQSGA